MIKSRKTSKGIMQFEVKLEDSKSFCAFTCCGNLEWLLDFYGKFSHLYNLIKHSTADRSIVTISQSDEREA